MPPLRLTGSEFLTALERAGFVLIRRHGSHCLVRHTDGRATVIPIHAGEIIGPGLVAKILRDVGLSREQIELDDDLVEEARRLTGIGTKRALVEEALRVLINSRRRRSLLELQGKIAFAEGYDHRELRRDIG